jgi:ABC-type phosphate transport system substrate-binding protein
MKRFVGFFTLVLVLMVALVVPVRRIRAEEKPFVVIVNSQSPSTTLSKKFVGDAFLKKVTRWPNGEVIKPVDLPASSTTRARFSEDVLNRSVSSVKSYWQQVIFSGRDVPPPELATEAEVVKYVATNPNAIGYVSGGTALTGVKSVALE